MLLHKVDEKMIIFSYHSGVYILETEQNLPVSVKDAWDFFANPNNLAKITPPKMGFEITSGNVSSMFPGQIITYKIGIFPFIKTNWVTEITHVDVNNYFVDEQRFGPYSMWHHQHSFIATPNGTKMRDKVCYKIPFGFIGRFAHSLFIKNQLHQIFSYRFQFLSEKFKSDENLAA